MLGKGQLGDQDLARLGQHPLLTSRQTAVALPAPEVAHDLGDLHDVTGVKLFQIRLVTARPVRRLLGVLGAQHAEDPLEAVLVHDVTHPDQVQVAGRNPHHQVVLGDDAQHEVEPVLALDLSCLDVLDDSRPMIGIDDRFPDAESHVVNCPFLSDQSNTAGTSRC